MPKPNEKAVRAILTPYDSVLFSAVHGGWDDWGAMELGGRLLFPARSRACVVYDFIVQRAMAVLGDDPAVRIIRRDETVKFIFAETVALRFKKANDKGLGSNIATQATLGFVEQQQQLPGLPNVHKVEVVYVLNGMQTRIDEVLVAARDGDVCLWSYDIAPDTSARIIPLPMPAPGDGGRGARIKVRKTNEGMRNETGEK